MGVDIGVIAGYGFELSQSEVEELLLCRGLVKDEFYEEEYNEWLSEGICELFSDSDALYCIKHGGGAYGDDPVYFVIINHRVGLDSLELQIKTLEQIFVGKKVEFIKFGYHW